MRITKNNIYCSINSLPFSIWFGVFFILLLILLGLFAHKISPAPPNSQVLEFRNKPPGFRGQVIRFRHRKNLPIQTVAIETYQESPEGVYYDDLIGRQFFISKEKLERDWNKSFTFILGSDQFGRDVLSRVLFGTRISLAVGVCASTLSLLVGIFLGGLAGYFGRWTETIIMRVTDMMFGFPVLLFLIAITSIFEPSLLVVFIAIGLVSWPGIVRLVRGQVLSVKHQEYVLAAQTIGLNSGRILWRYILPNCISPIVVTYTLGIGSAILAEASLSFLGLGAQPPTPSWGSMINLGKDFIRTAPWISVAPGVAIAITVLAFNLLGDSIRDHLDPHMKK